MLPPCLVLLEISTIEKVYWGIIIVIGAPGIIYFSLGFCAFIWDWSYKYRHPDEYAAKMEALRKEQEEEDRIYNEQLREAYKLKHGDYPPDDYDFENDYDYQWSTYYTDYLADCEPVGSVSIETKEESTSTKPRRSWFSRKKDNGDVEKAYRQGMEDGLWGDSFRYDSNRKGRTERERHAYEQGYFDHADYEDM